VVKIEDILNKLREVIDPELGYDIVSLGEIEEIREENGMYIIKFLPTSPLCPFISAILEQIDEKLKELNIYENSKIEIDFENRWSLDRISPEVRKELGL
jgi:metal-sulfur cluster biosynthetic enzyme